MQTPLVTMERSAMSAQQKHAILGNDLVRRLSMIDQKVDMEEKLDVVNKFTKNLKTSGYNRNQCMELVTSGVRGFMNKQVNRKKNGEEFYRSAKKTMGKRIHKKLTEKTNWYRKKKENDTERNFVGLNANGLPSWRRYHG
jgi:pyruvate/2-oxoacid:ferredoxin oxidoreductase alpha subunit